MSTCKETTGIPEGTIPEEKDGIMIWQEKDSKGAELWLSKPVKKDNQL